MKASSGILSASLLICLISVSSLAIIGAPQVSALPSEIVVDDVDAIFVGNWRASTLVPGYYGVGYRVHDPGTGLYTTTWSFNIPESGVWHVFAQWSNRSTRASNAKYTVNHEDGATIATVNQQINGWSWQSLGDYRFEAASYSVVLSDNANSYVIADAIRLVPTGIKGRGYGGTEDDIGTGETIQTSNGFAISGDTKSFGAGGSDFWLIRTDATGKKSWSKTYGGSLDETIGEMCSTTDSGYALVGGTYSFGLGDSDFWLVKTNSIGDVQWSNTYGGAGFDCAMSILQTSDGGYAVFGVTESFGAGGQDFYLVKTDSASNIQWSKTYGGTGDDYGTSVCQASDGGFAIAGYTNSFGAGGNDFWLIKTDSNGNIQWNMTYGESGDENAYQLKRTIDGGYAIIGYSTSFGDFNAYLVKTDSMGKMQWNRTYFSPSVANSLTQTMDGGFAIAGFTLTDNEDMSVAKTDETGNLEWNKTYGGTGTDRAYSIIQTSEGGYALTGWTTSFGAGAKDICLVKIDEFGVVPESLTAGIMLLISTVAVIAGTNYFRKGSKIRKNH